MRILQLADLHLDTPLADLAPEKRRARRADLRTVLRRAMEAARSKSAGVVLVPGDLLETGLTTSDTLTALAESFEEVSPIPVVIAPGNRDYFAPGSTYAMGTEGFAERRSAGPWPPNVHVFSEPHFTTRAFEGFSVTGIAHVSPGVAPASSFAGLDAPDDDRVHFLLLHGTRAGLPLPPGKVQTFPFTTAELVSCGFDFAALGHVHEHYLVKDGLGRVVAAYAGAPAALPPERLSRGGVLLGEVERGEGLRPESIELMDLDPRRSRRIEVRLEADRSRESVRDRVRAAVAAECGSEDIVTVVLTGRLDPAVVLDPVRDLAFLAEERAVFHAHLVDETDPDYDLEDIRRDRESTRGAFVDSLLEGIASRSDPREGRLLRETLVYGLDAFSGREVRRRERGDP